MLIYGIRAAKIGTIDVEDQECQFCYRDATQEISVFGKYFHIFWIPIFPVGKKAVVECTGCFKTREQAQFNDKVRNTYEDGKSNVKRPFWHWIGLLLLGILILFLTVVISFASSTSVDDPRKELLNADIESMSSFPMMESDSVSTRIKTMFDVFAVEEIDANQFDYRTRTTDSSILVLVKIPNLKKVEREARLQALEMVNDVLDNQKSVAHKTRYIGIHGNYTMMIVKTPTDMLNSTLALTSPLHEFYGPVPLPVKE